MAKKRIGELLLERGVITSNQLARALRDQQILGGHLGTCLIELGFVDEDVLGGALGELLNARYARWSDLSSIPPEVIRMISPELAQKYSVVPLRLEANALHVAAIAARTLTALSSATKRRIVPWVSPEIRILQALKQHYGIPMKPRYIKLGQALEQRATMVRAPVPAAQPLAESDDPQTGVYESTGQEVEVGTQYGYGRNWKEIAAEYAPGEGDSTEDTSIEVVDGNGPDTAVPVAAGFARDDLETIQLAQSLMRGHISLAHGLLQLGFLRSDHNLWGEFACCVVARLLKLVLYDEGDQRGVDARDAEGRTYQIAATPLVPGAGCTLRLRPCDIDADYLVGISILPSLEITELIRMPFSVARSLAEETTQGYRLTWDAATRQRDSVEQLDPAMEGLLVLPDLDDHFHPSAVED